jgi:hypothetical protein
VRVVVYKKISNFREVESQGQGIVSKCEHLGIINSLNIYRDICTNSQHSHLIYPPTSGRESDMSHPLIHNSILLSPSA